jgi:hypothetical protein
MPDGRHPTSPTDRARGPRVVDLTDDHDAMATDDVVAAAVDTLETAPAGTALTLSTPLEHGHPGTYLFLPLLAQFGPAIELEYLGERETAHVSLALRQPREARRR